MMGNKSFLFKYKIILAILLVLFAGGSWLYVARGDAAKKKPSYVLAAAARGSVMVLVGGSGNVSITNQIDIKPKISGTISRVRVKKGDFVKRGTTLIELDMRDAKKYIRDAQENVQSAMLALQKLQKPADRFSLLQAENALAQAKRELELLLEPADELSILQAENALEQSKESKEKSEADLKKNYDDGFNSTANAFLDLPTVLSGLEDMLFRATIDRSQGNSDWYLNQAISWNYDTKARLYKNDVVSAYTLANDSYEKIFSDYKAASRTSSTETIEQLISQTYATTRALADAVKSANNYIDFVEDLMQDHNVIIPSAVTTHQALLDTYTAKTNTHLASLLSTKTAITDAKSAIINAQRSIGEKSDTLRKLQEEPDSKDIAKSQEAINERLGALEQLREGSDALDVKAQELSIQQRKYALADAREKLQDYAIRAAFDGIVASMDGKNGDAVSGSTVIGRLITRQKIAEVTLNEVDVAKVKVGQQAVVSFDAVPDVSISGSVADIATVGESLQGVVSYTLQLSLDTQDERIRPGMSVSASIITDTKLNVLTVPTTALKSQSGKSYVEIAESTNDLTSTYKGGVELPAPPVRRKVETGLANDEVTEIISGISEGALVVISVIDPTALSRSNKSGSGQQPAIRIPGLPGGGRGFNRGGGGESR